MSARVKVDPSPGTASRRRNERHRIHLSLGTKGASEAILHDISSSGLLLQSSAKLDLGEFIKIALPEAADLDAKVIWQSGDLFGCEFERPISKAALSAALLMSTPLHSVTPTLPPVPVRRLPPLYRLTFILGLSIAAWAALKLTAQVIF